MVKGLRFLSVLVWGLFASAATAQNINVNDLLLRQQPNIEAQLQGMTSPKATSSSDKGIPNAADPTTVNAEDVQKSPELLVQTEGGRVKADSVVQRYFQILTGQVLEVYGAREFSQQQDSKLLFFNTVGKSYRLAPGDVVRVTLRGLAQSDDSLKIGRDGNLILPNLPPLAVSGLTISDVEENLLEILQFDDASASVAISLETARLITVQVSGEVNQPRTLAVPAYTPLSRVLAYAGGVKPTGSLRNIVLRDRDGSVATVDFYDFLQSPLGANDPLVTDASRIFVPSQGATVATLGFAAHPGIYELPAGQARVSVNELLALSGTRILPPGLKLEAKYFDERGISSTRELSRQDEINAGEALNFLFVETRLQDAVTVTGAVLDEYSMASRSAISVDDLLKGGATLQRDARLDFAMIIRSDRSVRAINLERALHEKTESIPVGATLVVFDQPKYRTLVDADPNETNDPLVSAISQAEVAELYLNGKRLAYIPPTQEVGFADIMRPYYRLTPKTNLDLAILEGQDGIARAVSLRSLLQGEEAFPLAAGAKIHLFETSFLNNFVKRIDGEKAQLDGEKAQLDGEKAQLDGRQDLTVVTSELGEDAPLARLLSRAGVLRVQLDGALLAVLPATASQNISEIFDVLGLERAASNLADFVEITRQPEGGRRQVDSLSLVEDYRTRLSSAEVIEFWSQDAFSRRLTKTSETDLAALFQVGVPVFVDYELKNVLSPSAFVSADGPAAQMLFDERTYPLFAIQKVYSPTAQRWKTRQRKPRNILGYGRDGVSAGSQIYLFSRQFVSDTLNKKEGSQAEQVVRTQKAALGSAQEGTGGDATVEMASDLTAGIDQALTQASRKLQETGLAQMDAALLQSYSRFVGGAVQRPGYYPVVGAVSLNHLIDIAGGMLDTANRSRVLVTYFRKTGGMLQKGRQRVVDLSLAGREELSLSGHYVVDVSFLINEAQTGIVTLSGEVMRPGEYVISRTDTLHDVIARAGGLSPVAYPLGAVFTRESLKSSQRDINDLLATQLEQAVLQVAGSDKETAGDQVKAVLGYAQQLRAQDATGRMAVNVTYANNETPVYLEPGDRLIVPKRPSHVAVIGAVNRDTTASYSPGKTLGSYLAAAGGTTRVADLKRAYLLLPNGESAPISNDALIPPGAAIVVPPRTDRLTVLGLTDLVSRVLGNIATSVLAINNVK